MRREAGKCYKCGDPYFLGHQCKLKQILHLLREEVEGREQEVVEEGETVEGEGQEDMIEGDVQDGGISLHALSGKPSPNTFRVRGIAEKRSIGLLIDSGNTNSFIDEALVKDLGLNPKGAAVLKVTVANGAKMCSEAKCEQFTWVMHGKEFVANLRVLTLGGCDVVLGLDWMENYNPIHFDLKNREVTIHHRGEPIKLKAERNDKSYSVMAKKGVQKLFKQGIKKVSGHLFMLLSEESKVEEDSTLGVLLQEYSDVFEEPTELPPTRTLDHKIPLKANSKPKNIRPYRYPYF